MKIPSLIVLLLFVIFAVMLAASTVAYGQAAEPPPDDGEDDEEQAAAGAISDSLAAHADSLGVPVEWNETMQSFQNVGPGTRPRVAQEPKFNPVYKLSYNQDEDVGTWHHDFTINYPLSQRLKFNSSASITTKDNEVLNRENRQESWRAGLDYSLTNAVGMAVKFNRSYQIDTRNQGAPTEVETSREKETMDFSTSYKKTHFSGVATSLSLSAGLEQNDYADITSQGTAQNISAGVDYEIVENLNSSFGYSGRHSVLDSKQGDFESTDESISHSVNADFDYAWDEHTFRAGIRRSYSETQYPKEEQTEQREQENEAMSFGTDFQPLENLGLDFSYDYSRSQAYYAIEETRDSDTRSRSVSGKIDYRLGETTITAQLQSEKNRNDQFSIQTGDTYSDSFGGTIIHRFGPKLSANFRGSASLISYHYDDPEGNDQDRDLLNQEAALTVDYKPRNDIMADIFLRVKESQLIYIRTTRSGNNKTSNTYTIRPSIRKDFSATMSVRQEYELSADYTFYMFDRNSNSLIRNFGVTTELGWKILSGVNTTFTHRYRGQDEGSYVEGDDGIERYGKNSEKDDHTLSIQVRYRLFGLIDLEVNQDYSVQSKWVFEGETRRLSWEKADTSLQGKASMNHELDNGTKIRVSVSRTLRDAANITERQEDVWRASIALERTF